MKTFKQLIAEVAQPRSEDERAFKDKHLTKKKDYPVPGTEHQFTSGKQKAKRPADYHSDEDIEVYEGLDPVGQEDDDINNDGKVDDSDDYLHNRRRAIKKAIRKESVEQIDEISKKTLGSYVKKAASDIGYAATADDTNKELKRHKGIAKAINRLTKEEAEQLDELSPNTLHSYIKKAAADLDNTSHQAGGAVDRMTRKRLMKQTGKRLAGITGASGRLADKANSDMYEADLDEAVEVRHDRYLRSHGKKARDSFGGGGTWAFTHKDRGDVDYKNDKEVYQHSGKFADAKKAAQQWGKKHGHREVYVMESVELDEVSASTLRSYVDKAKADKARQQKARTVAKSDTKKYGLASDKERADAAHRKVGQRGTGISIAQKKLGMYPKDRAQPKVMAREEVELDEQAMTFQNAEKLKSKHLVAMDHHKKSGNSKGYSAHSMVVSKFEDAYDRHGTGVIPSGRIVAASQKAFNDYPHSNMKEEVELDEISNELKKRYHEKGREDVYNRFTGRGKYEKPRDPENFTKTGRPKKSALNSPESIKYREKIASRNKYLAKAADQLKKEEVDLTENFKTGSIKLNDGSSVLLKSQDANLLNQMFKDLNASNRKKMMDVAMKDKAGFEEILGFAREAL